MEIKQNYMCKDADGKLIEKEISLEFREIDRCRRSDAPLFYMALGMMKTNEKGEASFSSSSIEKMGTTFIDALIVKDGSFTETDFSLLKSDTIAVFQLNMEIFSKLVAPFLAANL